MIKSNQGSSARIVAAILCSMLVIILVLYVRQTNQYSTLLRLHHQSQTSLQEKIIDIARLKNELKVKDSQCTAELESLDKEATDCEAKSKTMKTELDDTKKKSSQVESLKEESDASLAAAKQKNTQIQEQLKKEAEACALEQTDLEKKLKECATKLDSAEAKKIATKPLPIAPPSVSGDKSKVKSGDLTADEISESLAKNDPLTVEESISFRSK